jgi:hypothetical protein
MQLQPACLAHIAEPLRRLAVPVSSLNLDPANARKHDERNLAAIKSAWPASDSGCRWWSRDRGWSFAPAMAALAARELGWAHVAAVVVDESEVEATTFAIADNRSAELAEWDDETLARLLESLPEEPSPRPASVTRICGICSTVSRPRKSPRVTGSPPRTAAGSR